METQGHGAKEVTAPPNPLSPVVRWFRDEEFYWRSLASCVWLALSWPLLFAVFLLTVNASFLSPISWISDTMSSMFSLSTISTIFLLQIICALATIPHAKGMSVEKVPLSANVKLLMFLLRPKQLSMVGFHVSFTFLTTFILKGYSSSGAENSMFISFLGLFLGLFYVVQYFTQHLYIAEFPVLPQTRLFRFKKVAHACLQNAVWSCCKSLLSFFILYILSCLIPSGVFPSFFASNNTVSVLGAISVIFNFSLIFDCFCISFVVVGLLHVSNTLVKIFNTQAFTFPISAASPDDANKTLADAMESADDLLKHVACLDYNILSRYQQKRRTEMFGLTPPGNQAHCWNRTSKEALKIIRDMRLMLINENGRKQEAKSLFKPSIPKTVGSQGLFSAPEEKTAELMNSSWIPSPSKLLASLTKTEKKSEVTTSIASPLSKQVVSPVPLVKPIAAAQTTKPAHPICIFDKLQMTLWCIEGLSNLAAISLKEDTYGVVQKKLPEIIGELLLLLEACEVYWKCLFNVPSSNHAHHVEAAQENTTHATSLKLATKTGLYTITTAFRYHISSVRLPTEQKKRLHAFLEFAE